MPFCQNCGAFPEPGAPACPRCGKSMATAPQPYQLPHPIYPGQPGAPGEPTGSLGWTQPGLNTCAMLGFVMSWLPIPFAGLVLSILGLIQCGQTGQRGRGFAIAGIILRVAGTVLIIVGIALLAYFAVDSGGHFPEWDWDDGFAFTLLGLR